MEQPETHGSSATQTRDGMDFSLTAKSVAGAVVGGIVAVGTGHWIATLMANDPTIVLAVHIVITVALVGVAGYGLDQLTAKGRLVAQGAKAGRDA